MLNRVFTALSLLIIPLLCSCEDKELVARDKEQSRRIAVLREELQSLKDKTGDSLIGDLSSQLDHEESLVEEKKGILLDLEKELALSKSERIAAEKSFVEYKKKYRVSE